MRISVIMPCYNAGRWVATALRSVAQQIYPVHEIIVIDDNSTDNSLAVIEQSGVPVKLLYVSARNAAVARNVGIEAASGDWIASDDVWYRITSREPLAEQGQRCRFMAWIGLRQPI